MLVFLMSSLNSEHNFDEVFQTISFLVWITYFGNPFLIKELFGGLVNE